jgi:hypothetical protein
MGRFYCRISSAGGCRMRRERPARVGATTNHLGTAAPAVQSSEARKVFAENKKAQRSVASLDSRGRLSPTFLRRCRTSEALPPTSDSRGRYYTCLE